jgi:GNAT superfamily N-acetyltransferase
VTRAPLRSPPVRPRRPTLEVHPLTPERWRDLAQLFGERGACAGCWCMYWRVPRADYMRGKGAGNRRAFRTLVGREPAPGVIGYVGDEPIGWCAIGPRESFPVLARSRILQPVDAHPVWSVVCFFIARPWRRRGHSTRLLREAVEFARAQGATRVEGYPVEPVTDSVPDVFAWTGFAATYARAGFIEVARRSPTRPIMRRTLRAARTASPRRKVVRSAV